MVRTPYSPILALASTLVFPLSMAKGQVFSETSPQTPRDWLRLAVEKVCARPDLDGLSAQDALPGAWLLSETVGAPDGPFRRAEATFALPVGELRLSRIDADGALRRFGADLYENDDKGALAPVMQVQTGGDCIVRSARRIERKGGGTVVLEQLDGDMKTLLWRETLQAPWPEGSEPNGPRVALIDSGLAYDLPLFRDRLARDVSGMPLGYDFWDLDPLPYDGDTSRNPFQPIRHGTPVASILAREAPDAALMPFRYPRPDMSRMGALIERIAKSGARIAAMPLGSRNPEEWNAFEAAMRAHPELLAIVSAGNNGRDIDASPLWPGTLELDNMIVVTSADDLGRLADGSNWGAKSVDLMVPGENQPVIDFRGASGQASGTSYAVPRVAALAARLLSAEPSLDTQTLKKKIFARAILPRGGKDLVSVGWIVDPDRD